ncbi:hypothetical protein IB238_05490 [Rhizobium sp. ARZ01]|uniref:hypothetical protein n=1 Tax=Rhizobium sp. ARZ01 TaxID=2769313 RepID=UPI00178536DB|nr:hypothetical protein [Rhizobium sp. ARZ01]MBD9372082.1 hypothetical protein [Rhizobium sp. ARZ01]
MADALATFRVHFHDGTSLDIEAGNSLVAEARARRERPGAFVKEVKIQIARESMATAAASIEGGADE